MRLVKVIAVILTIVCIGLLIEDALPKSSTIKVCRINSERGDNGSGFFVDDDLVMTATHVLKDCNELYVDGVPVEEVYLFEDHDLALLVVSTPEVEKPFVFGSELEPGAYVMNVSVLCNFTDELVTLWTEGIISTRVFYADIYFEENIFETDFISQPGCSGSVVLNRYNHVIGMVVGYHERHAVCLPAKTLQECLMQYSASLGCISDN